MLLQTEKSPILTKTEELCQTILNQSRFQELQQKIERFMNDEEAKSHYQQMIQRQQHLEQKEQQHQLTNEEIRAFQEDKEIMLSNDVIKGFVDAQQEMHKVQESVNQYVSKTFELGRLPREDDFPVGSCGPNCGCH